MSINDKIRIYRKYLGLTQEEMAVKAGINEKYYGRIERGESIPTIDYMLKICDAMNIDLSELMLIEMENVNNRLVVRNKQITSILIQGVKQHIDIHINRNVIFDKCEKSIWYSGYVGSIIFDEFEMLIYADGNIKGVLYKDYEEVLTLNDRDISNELRKYITNDDELSDVIVYVPFDGNILKKRLGNVFFVSESNWFSAKIVNNNTSEVIYDDIILDETNIYEIFNVPAMIFDYIFG